jgi:hypothetical protein
MHIYSVQNDKQWFVIKYYFTVTITKNDVLHILHNGIKNVKDFIVNVDNITD